jgi:hypothetical protein
VAQPRRGLLFQARTIRPAPNFGGVHVDDKLDFYYLLDREIGWFVAFENAPGFG